MKIAISLLLSLFMCLGFFYSCKPTPCPDNYEVKIDTEFVKEYYREPLKCYSGLDTLKFLSEKGDTITFVGQGNNEGYKKKDIFAEDNCSTKSTTYKQFIGYSFYPIHNYPSDIQYYVSRDLNSSGGIYFYILINKITFYNSSVLPPLSNPVYIQGLEVNGKIYNNVLKIFRNYDYKNSSYLYFSLNEGIIKIVLPNNETLSKIK